MSPRIKLFAILAIGAVLAMIALSILGYLLDSKHVLDDPEVAKITGPAAGAVFFALFLLLGFSLVPLLIRLFVVLQTRIGNGELALVQSLRAHESGVAFGIWALFATGLAIAAPAMLRELGGLRAPVGASEGVLVARIGMTIDEVRQRSSLPLPDAVHATLTGTDTLVGSPVFDFEVADSAIRFAQCRYYFLVTRADDDPRIGAISIGVSPETMTRAELVAAHARVQAQLDADGWRRGRYEYTTPEQQALHGGMTSSGDGYFWLKGDTLLQLQGKRMDDPQPGEDEATAGAWIQLLELRPPESYEDLTFAQ